MEREKTQDTRPVFMGTYLKDKKFNNEMTDKILEVQTQTIDLMAKLEVQNRVAIGLSILAIIISSACIAIL